MRWSDRSSPLKTVTEQWATSASSGSLDEKAQEAIQQSFRNSEQLLAEGRPKPAVQEIRWLMESVVTAFRGLNAGEATIEEKYFNKIAQELRRHQKAARVHPR